MTERGRDAATPSTEHCAGRTRFGGDYDLELAVLDREPIEAWVSELWEEVLGINYVAPESNFIELGGDSISALKVAYRIFSSLGIELEVVDLLESPSPIAWAALIRGGQRNDNRVVPGRPSWPQGGVAGERDARAIFPLSFSQEALWQHCRRFPDSWIFNMPLVLKLEGALDFAALQAAFDVLVERHDSFRTVFGQQDDTPYQRILREARLSIAIEDFTGASREEIAAALNAEEREPIPLDQAPPLRVKLLQLGRDEHLLSITIHHIVFDGWSYGVMFRELSVYYNDLRRGRRVRVSPSPPPVGHYAMWQRGAEAAKVFDEQLGYWKARLAGLRLRLLERDEDAHCEQPGTGRYAAFELDDATTGGLRKAAASAGSSLFACLASILQSVILQRTKHPDVAIGTVAATRSSPVWEGTIGFLVNALALRTDLSADPSLIDLARQNREIVRAALRHQEVPFGLVVDAFENDDPSRDNPFFQVMFVFLQASVQWLVLEGLHVARFREGYGIARGDLVLELEEEEGALRGGFYFDPAYFREDSVATLILEFRGLARAWAGAPHEGLRAAWSRVVR